VRKKGQQKRNCRIFHADMTRIALIQQANTAEANTNLARTAVAIRAAADHGARIVLLQELFQTEYFCRTVDADHFALAEPADGPTIRVMSGLARDLGVVLVVPFFERRAPGLYHNTAAVIDADGRVLGLYRKMHIPEDPGFHEKYYFTPGDLGYKVFDTAHGKIGVLICWDQWYPEAARLTALQGAELLVYPTAIGTLATESDSERDAYHDAWETIQRAHAVANGVFVASINRVGTEGGTTFWGRSFVAGPFGERLAQAGMEEEILYADIDTATIDPHRRTWPFLRDRRIDSYAGLLNRFGA
jgi:N-carbamoylputrescine amidase